MSEESVILFEDISSFQADAKSVVRAAVSLPLLMSPKKKLLEREARRILREVQRDQLK